MWDYNVHKRITMKQHLTPEQTAKLIELGFEKPKYHYAPLPKNSTRLDWWENKEKVYTIGELIEMLPDYINGNFVNWKIDTTRGDVKWSVGWDCFETGQFQWIRTTELVDVLYEMIADLKEKGKL